MLESKKTKQQSAEHLVYVGGLACSVEGEGQMHH
jgi:hypothetical protein